jgi:hypothetical protein
MGWLRRRLLEFIFGEDFTKYVVDECKPDIGEIRRQLRYAIQELFISSSGRHNDVLVSYVNCVIKNLAEETQSCIRVNAKVEVDKYVKSEMFIDHLVAKLNNKQLIH